MRLVMIVVTAMWVGVHAAMAQPAQGLGVAVVDFYGPSPLPPVEGLIPQERAADLLATLLAQSAEPGVFVRSVRSGYHVRVCPQCHDSGQIP